MESRGKGKNGKRERGGMGQKCKMSQNAKMDWVDGMMCLLGDDGQFMQIWHFPSQ